MKSKNRTACRADKDAIDKQTALSLLVISVQSGSIYISYFGRRNVAESLFKLLDFGFSDTNMDEFLLLRIRCKDRISVESHSGNRVKLVFA